MAAENQRAGKLGVAVFAMRSFPAGNNGKTHAFQVGDQLANLSRHTLDNATLQFPVPASFPAHARLRMRDITALALAVVQRHLTSPSTTGKR